MVRYSVLHHSMVILLEGESFSITMSHRRWFAFYLATVISDWKVMNRQFREIIQMADAYQKNMLYRFLPDRQKFLRFLINGIINIYTIAAGKIWGNGLSHVLCGGGCSSIQVFYGDKLWKQRFNHNLMCIFFHPAIPL